MPVFQLPDQGFSPLARSFEGKGNPPAAKGQLGTRRQIYDAARHPTVIQPDLANMATGEVTVYVEDTVPDQCPVSEACSKIESWI